MDMSVIMSGKSVETDNFFINLYDYWTNFYHENKKFSFFHSYLMQKLEMYIRKKWSKELPNVNKVFDKYKKGDRHLAIVDILYCRL